MNYLYYKKRYKYLSSREVTIQTDFRPSVAIVTEDCRLDTDGLLTAFKRYPWDGASWCPDFKWIMRGAFWHDIGFQLIRNGLISRSSIPEWNKLLRRCCLEDKAWKWQANVVYKAVSKFGKAAAHPNSRRRELCAP